jgi:hypothetical protein
LTPANPAARSGSYERKPQKNTRISPAATPEPSHRASGARIRGGRGEEDPVHDLDEGKSCAEGSKGMVSVVEGVSGEGSMKACFCS